MYLAQQKEAKMSKEERQKAKDLAKLQEIKDKYGL